MSLVLNHEVHQEKEKKEGATLQKHIEYAKIKATYEFYVLVAIGTLGPINNDGIVFIQIWEIDQYVQNPWPKRIKTQKLEIVFVFNVQTLAFRGCFVTCELDD